MSEQAGTSGFAKAFLPGLVLGIVIGAATTFAFFSLNEGGKIPKPNTDPNGTSTTPREQGGAVDREGNSPDADPGDPTGDPTGDPDADPTGDDPDGDGTNDTPPGDGG